jgi:HAD superfamily hydrolase (TIGR01509 family)
MGTAPPLPPACQPGSRAGVGAFPRAHEAITLSMAASNEPRVLITRRAFDGVIFDLDGVLTPTAEVHRLAWAAVFDEFLRERARERGERFRPFTEADYLLHVDGRSRHSGVELFLASRGIPPSERLVACLARLKNEAFLQVLRTEGVRPYPSSVERVMALRRAGFRVAVISASRNCLEVLRAARILRLFDTVVDGVLAARLGLSSKPSPDIFLEAAVRLGTVPERSVVVEDAIAGVQAGRAGGFELVVGVARDRSGAELLESGADVVVADLSALEVVDDAGVQPLI